MNQSSSDFMAAIISEPKKRKSVTAPTFAHSVCHEAMGLAVMILAFLIVLAWLFFHSFFTLIKKFFSSSSLSAVRVVSSTYLKLLIFPHLS